jgi:hypothetical protein
MLSSTIETSPNWAPLERRLKPPQCGECLVPAEVGWKEVPFEDEWKRVSGRA